LKTSTYLDRITGSCRYALPVLLLILLLFPHSLAARTCAEFTRQELFEIKKKYGQIHINLIGDYHKTMQEYRKLPPDKQLIMVNNYLNSLLPEYDSVRNNQEEYWSTPKEFLAMGTGDCEDYVSIKYFTLIDLGFNEAKLFFAVVKEESPIPNHMVLLYEDQAGKEPVVLDNLSFRILPLSVRTDLELVEFFNTTGRYKYGKNFEKIRLNGQNKQFLDLRRKVRQGK